MPPLFTLTATKPKQENPMRSTIWLRVCRDTQARVRTLIAEGWKPAYGEHMYGHEMVALERGPLVPLKQVAP